MMTIPRFAVLVCLAACLGTITPAALTAQTPDANAKAEHVIAELEMHNTPVRDVIAFLRQQVPDANIVLSAEVGDIRISELKLRNVTLTQALWALQWATNGEVVIYPPSGANPGLFTVRNTVSKKANPRLENVTRVFLLPPWPEADLDKDLAAMLDAVNHLFSLARNARSAAGETDTALKPPSLEAHRPTRLLLVAGTRESVELAAEVIVALQGKTVDTDPARSSDKTGKPVE